MSRKYVEFKSKKSLSDNEKPNYWTQSRLKAFLKEFCALTQFDRQRLKTQLLTGYRVSAKVMTTETDDLSM